LSGKPASAGTTRATLRKSRNARPFAASRTAGGTGGSMASRSAGSGIDDTTCVHAYVVVAPSVSATTAVARPPSWRTAVTLVDSSTFVPADSTCSRQRSHIIPGPSLG
jgi:hypothetical protein